MSATSVNPRLFELLRFTKAHNRHTNALAQVTGERFNIFQILRVGHLEVTTHSPILAELLNPNGKHGQEAAFLRLFLARFEISGFEAETATVKLEYYIGPRTEKSGGRIDIVIKDGKGETIFIENKIYAGDQENQMTRYREFDRKAHQFYLTLDGREPSNLSEDEVKGIQCISYGVDILAWLKDCRKESACLHTVREIITQYIHLIEELTNQSTTILMNEELIDAIIQDEESFRAFDTLRNAEAAVHAALIARLDAEINTLAEATKFERLGQLQELSSKEAGFAFTTPGLRAQNLQVCFEFDAGGYRNFFFGFALLDAGVVCPIVKRIASEYAKRFRMNSNPDWPAWTWWEEYRYWGLAEFEAIRSGQFAKDLKIKLEHLAEIANAVCPEKADDSAFTKSIK